MPGWWGTITLGPVLTDVLLEIINRSIATVLVKKTQCLQSPFLRFRRIGCFIQIYQIENPWTPSGNAFYVSFHRIKAERVALTEAGFTEVIIHDRVLS